MKTEQAELIQDNIDKIQQEIMNSEGYIEDDGGFLAGSVGHLDRAISSIEEYVYRTREGGK